MTDRFIGDSVDSRPNLHLVETAAEDHNEMSNEEAAYIEDLVREALGTDASSKKLRAMAEWAARTGSHEQQMEREKAGETTNTSLELVSPSSAGTEAKSRRAHPTAMITPEALPHAEVIDLSMHRDS